MAERSARRVRDFGDGAVREDWWPRGRRGVAAEGPRASRAPRHHPPAALRLHALPAGGVLGLGGRVARRRVPQRRLLPAGARPGCRGRLPRVRPVLRPTGALRRVRRQPLCASRSSRVRRSSTSVPAASGPTSSTPTTGRRASSRVYLKAHYLEDPVVGRCASVFTIHNIAYQGVFDPDTLGVLGFPWHYGTADALEFHGGVSYLEGGHRLLGARQHGLPDSTRGRSRGPSTATASTASFVAGARSCRAS